MSKKKLTSLEDLGGFVFSTNDNFEINKTESQDTLHPNQQYLEAHFSNKGRGGKTVTVITGFLSDNPETSDYWSLYLDDGQAHISLEDIILKADNCIEMGVSTDKSESATAPK